jgi:hypothetical protein
MATSETLAFRIGLGFMSNAFSNVQSFPNLLHESVGFVSFPVPRRFPRLHLTVSSPWMLPSPLLHRLGNRIVRPSGLA